MSLANMDIILMTDELEFRNHTKRVTLQIKERRKRIKTRKEKASF
jgi:hypothetical protein